MKKQKIIASILSAVFSANLLMVNTSQAKITEPQETNIQITQSAEEEIQNLETELEKLKDKETGKNDDAHIKHLKENSKSINDDVMFVSDEKITIDSQTISRILNNNEKKGLKFVSPDKNSSNILSRELFPDGSPKPEDVQQARLGLCYFFAVLSTVAEKNPELIKNNLVEDGKGNVIVKFFNPNNGSPYYVKVQKTVPQVPNLFKFVKNDCLWVQMYLKAFVASGFSGCKGYIFSSGKKNYRYAEFGFMDLVMRMITGKNTEIKNALSVWMSNKEKLYKKIEKSLAESCYVTCDFSSHLNVIKMLYGAVSNEGLVRGHAYSIERVYEDKEGQKWIVVRNPWGEFTSTYDKNGKRILNPSDDNNKGYSVLKFEDFLSMCGRMYFSKNKNIKKRGFFKRFLDFIDPVPYIIRIAEEWILIIFASECINLSRNPIKKLMTYIHIPLKNSRTKIKIS